jgi:PhoH-like ATPase
MQSSSKKLFVLDTNVLLHDASALFRFQEHDLLIPMITLEELDNQKKGHADLARSARQVSRFIDELLQQYPGNIEQGIPLSNHQTLNPLGLLFLQTPNIQAQLAANLSLVKADNDILSLVNHLQTSLSPREVILVSKDINMRIKGRALNLKVQDYFNDKIMDEADLLFSGMRTISDEFWTLHGKHLRSWQDNGRVYYQIQSTEPLGWFPNEIIHQNNDDAFAARVIKSDHQESMLETLRDFSHQKNAVWGLMARNPEQNFALNLLMNPDIDFVSISGAAGTGKTMLTLAAALQQTLEQKLYEEIIMTRVTVPLGEDIGFLPGTEEEKMNPWMGALTDNLEALTKTDTQHASWEKAATMDLVAARIKIKSINFMRGRTFIKRFLIIDEAQNLTPKQLKSLISRAGEGTKVVCIGNLAQIDTPYLTEGSSGLAYVVDRFKIWEHAAHITLSQGERSRLADFTNNHL